MDRSFGLLVKEKRKSLGYSQEQLSDETGLSLRTIQRIENEETNPRGHSLQAIAKVLDIPLGENPTSFKAEENLEIKTKLNLINSSALIGIVIPYSNLFIPLIVWLKNRKNHQVDIYARNIINFQITWVLITSLLLACAPFAQLLFVDERKATTFKPVLIVYCIAIVYNVIAVLRASKKINSGNYKTIFYRVFHIF